MEEWKTVEGSKGFIEISNEGRVRSLLRGTPRILKTQEDKKGYLRIKYTIERTPQSHKVHRMVANAFIPNPNNYPQVNHIDGNKKNNRVENLEWCTNKDNVHHAIENGLWISVFAGVKIANEKQKKPIVGYKDGETKQFSSVREAEKFLDSRHVTDVLKGKRNHVKGWTLAYEKGVVE